MSVESPLIGSYSFNERSKVVLTTQAPGHSPRPPVKATEATLDIGRAILAHERESVPETNPGVIRELGSLGILPEATTDAMIEAARFRNVLAHTYGEDIDAELVYEALGDLDRYRDFLRAVRTYLESD